MNVSSFGFCLGHEDPGIVVKGLDTFSSQVLVESDATDTFGYCGRGLSSSQRLRLRTAQRRKGQRVCWKHT